MCAPHFPLSRTYSVIKPDCKFTIVGLSLAIVTPTKIVLEGSRLGQHAALTVLLLSVVKHSSRDKKKVVGLAWEIECGH